MRLHVNHSLLLKLFRLSTVYTEPLRFGVSFSVITLQGTPLTVNLISISPGVPPVTEQVLDGWPVHGAAILLSYFCRLRVVRRWVQQA